MISNIERLQKIANESTFIDSLANMNSDELNSGFDRFGQNRGQLEHIYNTVNDNRDLLDPHGEYNNVFDWYSKNKDAIDSVREFSNSPISSLFTGDYDNVRDNLDFYDKLISENTSEYKYGRKFLDEQQLSKLDKYKRWRPLIALWMNLRGLFHSLMGSSKYRSMNVFGGPKSTAGYSAVETSPRPVHNQNAAAYGARYNGVPRYTTYNRNAYAGMY